MERVPIKSSQIRSIGYEAAHCRLEVEFNTGAIYEYIDVPADVHTRLMSATSIGTYFSSHVRKGNYIFKQIN